MNYYDFKITFQIFCLFLVFWAMIANSVVFTVFFIAICIVNMIHHWDRLHILTDKFLNLFDKEKF
jgi:hypothetical protein